MTFSIQDTADGDQPAIEHLLDLSFGIDRRTKTSYRLREGSHAAEGLSLVIRDDGVGIAGAISFWPLAIGGEGAPALLLGPLAVHPERQNLGIGLALMREGLARAKALGHRLVILVGDEPYYARAGFKKLPRGLLMMPGPTNPDRFLYLELQPGALDGVSGMVLPPHRYNEKSAAFAIPHGAGEQQQRAKA
jgi:predicted N-acetyltransferase YhbS